MAALISALLVPVLAGLLLTLAVLFGVRRVALAVMLVRPSCDPVFGWVKAALNQSTGPGGAINVLVIGLALISLVHAPRLVLSPTLLVWGVFLLAAIASLLHGPDPAGGMRLLLTLTTYAAAFSLPFAIVRDRETAAQCLWIALLSSLGPAVWAVVQLSTTPGILVGEEPLPSTFGQSNIFAYFILGTIALILFLTRSTLVRLTPARRRMLHAYIVALLLLLPFTQARSAWIAMTAFFVGHAIFVDRRWLAFLLVLPSALLIPVVADRVADLNTNNIDMGYATLNSFAWREMLWDKTTQWMADNPSILLGHGLDLFPSYLPLFFPQGEQEGGAIHNTFLQIYFEMGLIGLAAFLAIFVALFAQLRRGLAHDRDGAIVMATLCVSYFPPYYSDNMLDYVNFQWFLWFVLGAVLAWIRGLTRPRGRARPTAGELAVRG